MNARALLCAVSIALTIGVPMGTASAFAQDGRGARAQGPAAARRAEQQRRQREENVVYLQAQRALDEARWSNAIELLSRLTASNGNRRDAALYWMAYAQNRLGQRAEALQSIAELAKAYPNSRYATQGRALEVEVRRDAGQSVSPEGQNDDGLKLMALQALQRSDPERAAPMLEDIVRSTSGARLKTRALFLLAQTDSPLGRQVLASVARGETSPDIQDRAIDYLAARQTPENRALLSEIYSTSADVRVKRQVMRAFTRADDAESLVALARKETVPARRRELVQNLSLMRNKVALDYLAEILKSDQVR
jgi:hypothetical protein